MTTMTEGLQMTAGDRIKKILGAVSSNRMLGFISGAAVTAIIQSSSATTVMLISFVGAGMMTLQQAVGVVLGANVGTTITAQMIAFKLTNAALPAIAIGVALKFFSKKKQQRYIGEVILGFGLLFYGMTVMKLGLTPIKGDPGFISFFTKFDTATLSGLLLCVATGAVLTVIVQSSSATIGLTMALAAQGLLSFPTSMALVMGENIGTTITAQLATIGSKNVNSYRVARAHGMFNVIGVIIVISIFPYFLHIVEIVTEWMGSGALSEVVDGDNVNVARYIANGHSIFNILNALIFLIFLPWLIRVSILLSPKQTEEATLSLPSFDQRFLDNTIAALTRVKGEVIRMADVARQMFENTTQFFETRDIKRVNQWIRYEQHLDSVQRLINAYLITIYQSDVNQSEAKEISGLMRITNNLERIGDSIENIAQMIETINEDKMEFSQWALSDIKNISSQVLAFILLVVEGMYEKPPGFMDRAQQIEDNIDFMREEMRQEHIERLGANECSMDAGLIFSDILSNFEKIGDYCYNIAQAIAGVK
jgi:phosphate:Na+ symporter